MGGNESYTVLGRQEQLTLRLAPREFAADGIGSGAGADDWEDRCAP